MKGVFALCKEKAIYGWLVIYCYYPKKGTKMSSGEWIVVISAFLTAIVAAIIPIVLGIVMQPKKQVTYEVTSSIRVLYKEVARQIRATFESQPISNAQLISVRVKNTGKQMIIEDDYVKGTHIKFSFGNDTRALDAKAPKVLAVDQTNAPKTPHIDPGGVSLAPFPLVKRQSVDLDILVTDFKGDIIVETPQFKRPGKGERDVEQKVKGIKVPLSSTSPHLRNMLLTFITLAIASFILLSFVTLLIYEYFYNENFSVYLSNILYLSVFVASFIAAIMMSTIHIVSNYFSPLEVGTGYTDPNIPFQTILRMDEHIQRFPLIHYVWTIFAFLIIAPLLYLLIVLALETSIGTYIYTVAYPNSYVGAFINSALWSVLIITIIISIFTRFALNERLHKRYPLKKPAITPKISRDFVSPQAVQRLSLPLEIPCQEPSIPSLNVKLERIDFYQPDDQSMKWTFTLNNIARDVCGLSVHRIELENTARRGFDRGQLSGVADVESGQTRRITASFPLPQLNQPYILHLILACGLSPITYADQSITFGVNYQLLE